MNFPSSHCFVDLRNFLLQAYIDSIPVISHSDLQISESPEIVMKYCTSSKEGRGGHSRLDDRSWISFCSESNKQIEVSFVHPKRAAAAGPPSDSSSKSPSESSLTEREDRTVSHEVKSGPTDDTIAKRASINFSSSSTDGVKADEMVGEAVAAGSRCPLDWTVADAGPQGGSLVLSVNGIRIEELDEEFQKAILQNPRRPLVLSIALSSPVFLLPFDAIPIANRDSVPTAPVSSATLPPHEISVVPGLASSNSSSPHTEVNQHFC